MNLVCIVCKKEFVSVKSTTRFCSNHCRCNNYYYSHLEYNRERSIKRYFQEKDNNYEKLRDLNKKASKRYKDKNRARIRIEGVLYQRKTKQSMKYRELKKFGGKRNLVLKRDNYKCTSCGSIKRIIVHHIDKTGCLENPNNDENNLITLCSSCHINTHREDLQNGKKK